ncbi:hypothetical protein FHS01_001904 [Longimicrobium terrae]|uniref:Uncharacterized protein n=1 Tax=Longimicrobium terrae TaxID=1639882 RepID=A0A841GWM7_9BACT|nr:hypothetical protein [Longimicrobium terrae]MBB6070284.1 hypothetical protein [Longimicrobium terrae]
MERGSPGTGCGALPVEYETCDWWNPCGGDAGGTPSPATPTGGPPPPSLCWECQQPDPNTPCTSGDRTIDSPGVNAIFTDLWDRSNPRAQHADRREQAAWILERNGVLTAVPMLTESTPCSAPSLEPPPPGAVGYIHTHPYGLGNVPICDIYYGGTASSADIDTMRLWGFDRAYILDEMGIGVVTDKTVGTETIRKSRCRY